MQNIKNLFMSEIFLLKDINKYKCINCPLKEAYHFIGNVFITFKCVIIQLKKGHPRSHDYFLHNTLLHLFFHLSLWKVVFIVFLYTQIIGLPHISTKDKTIVTKLSKILPHELKKGFLCCIFSFFCLSFTWHAGDKLDSTTEL